MITGISLEVVEEPRRSWDESGSGYDLDVETILVSLFVIELGFAASSIA